MDALPPAWTMFGAASLLLAVAVGAASAGAGLLSRRRRSPPRPPSGPELLAAAILRLRVRPFDRMAPGDQASVSRLLGAAEAASSLPEVRARINLMMAETELIAGRPDRALERYRAALRWRPGASVQRTIGLLERRLSPVTPVRERLAA